MTSRATRTGGRGFTINAPWVWPVLDQDRVITAPFNERRNYGKHEGVDIRAREGKRIVAVEAGVVTRIYTWNGSTQDMNAYGNHVVVKHTRADTSVYSTWYCHLMGFAGGLAVGTPVLQGQLLGLADCTGNCLGDHLHLMLTDPLFGLTGYVFPRVLDPTPFLQGGLVPPDPGEIITNQQVINELFALGPELGVPGGELLERLVWLMLAKPDSNRRLPFDFTRLDRRPGVTDEQWTKIVERLRALQP